MHDYTGSRIGAYTLMEHIGVGDNASVYRSHHPQFNRPVAIKVIDAGLAQSQGFRERFAREARALAALNHPGIVRIYAMDQQKGLFFIVMDLLPGGALEQRLQRSTGLERRWSTRLVAQIADTLEYAHSLGVVHRDLKPSNVLFDAQDRPVLADFGMAQIMQEGILQPALPLYSAPEQLRGERPDARADIYALGAILYQLLTGRTPFQGTSAELIAAHLNQVPAHPRSIASDLPPALEAVLMQALDKDPYQRFSGASIFARALRSAAEDLTPAQVHIVATARPQPSQRREAAPQLPPSDSRRRDNLALAMLALAALLIILAWWMGNPALSIGLLLVSSVFFFYLRNRQTSTLSGATPAPSEHSAEQPGPWAPSSQVAPGSFSPMQLEEAPQSNGPPARLQTDGTPPPLPPSEAAPASSPGTPPEAPTAPQGGIAPDAPSDALSALASSTEVDTNSVGQSLGRDRQAGLRARDTDQKARAAGAADTSPLEEDAEEVQSEDEQPADEEQPADATDDVDEEELAAREVNSENDGLALALGASAPLAPPAPNATPSPPPEAPPEATPTPPPAAPKDEPAEEEAEDDDDEAPPHAAPDGEGKKG